MFMAIFTFEVPVDKQEEYIDTTSKIIKPFWEANECLAYTVYQDYFISPEHFVKIQQYPDKETMERSLRLAREDEKGKEIVAKFMKFIKPDTLVQRRVIPRIS